MRRNNITFLVPAVFAIVLGALLVTVTIERSVYRSYETQVSMQSALASIRLLQINTRALQSERAGVGPIRDELEQARAEFDGALNRLNRDIKSVSADPPELRRIANTWERMQTTYGQVRSSMNALEAAGFFERIGNSGLVVAYQEMLNDPQASDTDLAELSLLMFHLEQVDRLVLEIETELRSLQEDLRVQTADRVKTSRNAAIGVLVLSLLLALVLLWRIAHLYGSVQADNTARRVAEQSARASEADLTITLNAIGEAVLATDTAGRLVRLNPAAERLIGWSEMEACGRPLDELFKLVDVETKSPVPNPVEVVLRAGVFSQQHERVLLARRDGGERELATLATPIRDEQLAVRGVVLVMRDVTEHHRLEEQLRRIQRIESLGQLAGGVAHDFNNILQIVSVNVSFLGEMGLPVEARQCLSEIEEAASRAADLTKQLLALGRRQTLQVKEHDPAALVKGILQLVRRVIGEHIEVDFLADGKVDWVKVDAGQLEQVVLNLCVNARDAMPNGGQLTLKVVNVSLGPEETDAWPWAKPGRYAKLTVTDTGIGMSPETAARIFEPFFTTKPAGKGSGLGLSVVQGILHQHGGFINVYSEQSKGTTFSLYLPSYPRPDLIAVPRPIQTPDTLITADTTGALILLAEDDLNVRNVAQAILRRHGFRVIAAVDGEEACQLAQSHGDEVRVAVLDVVMPRMGGIEAARRIQAIRPSLPIILCTGYAGGISLPEFTTAGWRLLTKPYTNQELVGNIQRAIAHVPAEGA